MSNISLFNCTTFKNNISFLWKSCEYAKMYPNLKLYILFKMRYHKIQNIPAFPGQMAVRDIHTFEKMYRHGIEQGFTWDKSKKKTTFLVNKVSQALKRIEQNLWTKYSLNNTFEWKCYPFFRTQWNIPDNQKDFYLLRSYKIL